jgi:hypothetical protein
MHLRALTILFASCIAAAAAAATDAHVVASERDIITLDNGIRVVFVPIEDSSDIAIITTVPMGLCGDERGCAQWSHLVEHLVVTQEGIQPFDEINAETMNDAMHLDYTRPAATWDQGLRTHARWLRADPFEADAVEREIGRVIAEVDGLAAAGRTTKFANAAWAQAIRHGVEHVAMNGDVSRATPEALRDYYARLFLMGPRPVIVVAGKFQRESIEQTARALLEPIALPAAPATRPPWADPEDVPSRITWDLPTSHAVFAWRIPDDLTRTDLAHLHAAMPALSQLVSVPAAAYIRPGSYVLPEADVRVADRRYVVLNMTMQALDGSTMEQAADDVSKAAATLATARGPSRAMARISTVQQWQQFDDPAAVLQQMHGRGVSRRMIEGNLAVLHSLHEFRFAGELPAMIVALEQASDDAARAALGRVFTDENRLALLIVPAPPQNQPLQP